jgi:hypothetical protein
MSRFNSDTLNSYADECAKANDRWWRDPATGEEIPRNVGEMLMLIVSEIAEAMEAHRKSLNDDKLPQFLGIEVELVDAMIRIFDLAGHLGYDLDGAYRAKMEYNRTRRDHTHEARLEANGKRY